MKVGDRPFYLSIRPRYLCLSPMRVGRNSPARYCNLSKYVKSGARQLDGTLSFNSQKRIRLAIDWMLAAAQPKLLKVKKTDKYYTFRISFATLTLPTQKNKSDQDIKSIFNSFLTMAKYRFGLKTYIWKAEPQKRGTIHFHLTSDCFIHWRMLRFAWNRLLKREGLTGIHTDPNSTDIHAVYKIKNLAAYLAKYYCKSYIKNISDLPSDQVFQMTDEEITDKVRRPISGRLWGCSHNLSRILNMTQTVDWSEGQQIHSDLLQQGAEIREMDYTTVYSLPPDYWKNLPECKLKQDYIRALRIIRKSNFNYQTEIYDPENIPPPSFWEKDSKR